MKITTTTAHTPRTDLTGKGGLLAGEATVSAERFLTQVIVQSGTNESYLLISTKNTIMHSCYSTLTP